MRRVTPRLSESAWQHCHLWVFVPGTPAPQGSKRYLGPGRMVESSKRVAPWRTDVRMLAMANCRRPALTGAVRVRFEFVLPRPKSTPKRTTPPAVRRPDLDKLLRACLDALSGVAYLDDSQVTDIHTTKRLAELGEDPGVHIQVAPASELAAKEESA